MSELKKIDLQEKCTGANESCPVNYAVNLLSGKYKLPILYSLISESPKRFKALERDISGISSTMLSNQLKELEQNDLITRKAYATVPPTVEYSITPLGQTLLPILNEVYKWGSMHQSRLTKS